MAAIIGVMVPHLAPLLVTRYHASRDHGLSTPRHKNISVGFGSEPVFGNVFKHGGGTSDSSDVSTGNYDELQDSSSETCSRVHVGG